MKLLPIHRVSTERQRGDEGEGWDRQREATKRIAEAHGATLLPAIEVADVSGSDLGSTPEWRDQVVPAIQAPDTHIAVDSIDRLVRASGLDLGVLMTCQETETRVYTGSGVHDLSESSGTLVSGMLALMAGHQKKEIVRWAITGKEAARKRGEWVNRLDSLPLGLSYNRKAKSWGYTEDAQLVVEAFERSAAGETHNGIAKALGRSPAGIQKMLRQELYHGWLVIDKRQTSGVKDANGRQGRGKVVPRDPDKVIRVRVYGGEGQPDQLIPEPLWNRVQARLDAIKRNHHKTREQTRPEIWASGYLRSGTPDALQVTGESWELADQDNHTHTIYGQQTHSGVPRYTCKCSKRKNIPNCHFGGPSAEKMNAALDAYLTEVTRSDLFVHREQETKGGHEDPAVLLERIEKALRKQETKIDRYNDLYADGELSREKRDQRVGAVRQEIKDLEDRKAGLQVAAEPTKEDLDRLRDEWAWDASWDHETKRKWLARYVHSIRVLGGRKPEVVGATFRVLIDDPGVEAAFQL